jgi:hypothetical protein
MAASVNFERMGSPPMGAIIQLQRGFVNINHCTGNDCFMYERRG